MLLLNGFIFLLRFLPYLLQWPEPTMINFAGGMVNNGTTVSDSHWGIETRRPLTPGLFRADATHDPQNPSNESIRNGGGSYKPLSRSTIRWDIGVKRFPSSSSFVFRIFLTFGEGDQWPLHGLIGCTLKEQKIPQKQSFFWVGRDGKNWSCLLRESKYFFSIIVLVYLVFSFFLCWSSACMSRDMRRLEQHCHPSCQAFLIPRNYYSTENTIHSHLCCGSKILNTTLNLVLFLLFFSPSNVICLQVFLDRSFCTFQNKSWDPIQNLNRGCENV